MNLLTEDKNEIENENAPKNDCVYWTYNNPYFLVYSFKDLLFQTTDFDVLHETFPKIQEEYARKNARGV